MSKTIRFVSVLGLAAMAVASQAVVFNFTGSTTGVTLSPNGSGSFTSTGATVVTPIPFSFLNTAAVTLMGGGGNSTAVFSSTLANAPAGLGTFTVNFSGIPDNSVAGSSSLAAVATSFSGTGMFAGFNSGSLQVTSNTNNGTNLFTVAGNVNTPEPASLAALGVGAVALLRRRRKA